MNSYSKPNHGQDTGSTSDPMTFQRPTRDDATRFTIHEKSYDPHNPDHSLRFKRNFNEPDSQIADDHVEYDHISGQMRTSHQR